MTEKKNHVKRNLIIAAIILSMAISLIVFFQTQISGMISNHPKIAEIEKKQGLIEYKYDELKNMIKTIDYKLDVLDGKINKLSKEEYP